LQLLQQVQLGLRAGRRRLRQVGRLQAAGRAPLARLYTAQSQGRRERYLSEARRNHVASNDSGGPAKVLISLAGQRVRHMQQDLKPRHHFQVSDQGKGAPDRARSAA
jgi:hypothetical protein